MIAVFSCSCGGAETLIRQKLRKYGYSDWMTIPVYQGKEKSLSQLESAKNVPEVQMLINHINGVSSYAVILGAKDGKCAWSDVSRNDFASDVRAEEIVKALA